MIRPPERDIRESQPTISVNYRFIEKNNDKFTKNTYQENKSDHKDADDDWSNNNIDW